MKLIDFIDWFEGGLSETIKDNLGGLLGMVISLSIFVWGMNIAINTKEEIIQQKKQAKKLVVVTGIVESKRIVKGRYTIIFRVGLNSITYKCDSSEYGFFMKGDSYRLTYDDANNEMETLVRIK